MKLLINVEAERARLSMTKEEISEKLNITSTTYLSYIRSENPPTKILIRMSSLFGCSIDYLLGLSDQRNRAS